MTIVNSPKNYAITSFSEEMEAFLPSMSNFMLLFIALVT